MNGTEPKIEIFKPFGEAFELTKKILFEPFDLGKWCVIGFAAFLAGHFSGIGFNFSSSFGNIRSNRPAPNFIAPDFGQWKPWLPLVIIVLVLLFIGLVLA